MKSVGFTRGPFRVSNLPLICCFIVTLQTAAMIQASDSKIRLIKTQDASVDVLVGSKLFTSYHFGLGLHKPIFHPLKAPSGKSVTRGFPMEFGIAGEHTDHWHHEGVSFTYGDVDGVDFWAKYGPRGDNPGSGKIRHTGFTRIESGDIGRLTSTADWITPTGTVVLRQKADFTFHAESNWQAIDLSFVLTAQKEKVTFRDTKEGMMALRLASQLREDNSGQYLNAAGQEKEAGVWGKRSPWVALRGKIEGEGVTVALINHPESTGYPTYWHARGYGLFSANPFGRKDFEKGSAPLNFSLEPGRSANFLYRILVHTGELTLQEMERQFQAYLQTSSKSRAPDQQ